MRKSSINRNTKETQISCSVNLDGIGKPKILTGIGFMNHMLEILSHHSLIDIDLNVSGDTHVDLHHTVEDLGYALSQSIIKALGKKEGISFGTNEGNNAVSSIGMPINPYLWKGSLETISFMPLSSADPFGGIIITDWYSDGQTINERCKINIFIKGLELKTSNLKVNTFCQSFENNRWIDLPTSASQSAQLENAILNKAKRIKLAKN